MATDWGAIVKGITTWLSRAVALTGLPLLLGLALLAVGLPRSGVDGLPLVSERLGRGGQAPGGSLANPSVGEGRRRRGAMGRRQVAFRVCDPGWATAESGAWSLWLRGIGPALAVWCRGGLDLWHAGQDTPERVGRLDLAPGLDSLVMRWIEVFDLDADGAGDLLFSLGSPDGSGSSTAVAGLYAALRRPDGSFASGRLLLTGNFVDVAVMAQLGQVYLAVLVAGQPERVRFPEVWLLGREPSLRRLARQELTHEAKRVFDLGSAADGAPILLVTDGVPGAAATVVQWLPSSSLMRADRLSAGLDGRVLDGRGFSGVERIPGRGSHWLRAGRVERLHVSLEDASGQIRLVGEQPWALGLMATGKRVGDVSGMSRWSWVARSDQGLRGLLVLKAPANLVFLHQTEGRDGPGPVRVQRVADGVSEVLLPRVRDGRSWLVLRGGADGTLLTALSYRDGADGIPGRWSPSPDTQLEIRTPADAPLTLGIMIE
mgnify:CR=1 FL=1